MKELQLLLFALTGSLSMVFSQEYNAGEPCPGTPIFTDSRDGNIYHTVQIGEQCWMQSNLNIGEMINKSEMQSNNGIFEKYCYDDNEDICSKYGGLYQWWEVMQYSKGAQGLCPTGWHIPSESEWKTLIEYLGGKKAAGSKLKTPDKNFWYYPENVNPWTTSLLDVNSKKKRRIIEGYVDPNGSGFNAYGAGYLDGSPRRFDGVRELVLFWTSDQSVVKLYFHNNYANIYKQGDKLGASVRCLRD